MSDNYNFRISCTVYEPSGMLSVGSATEEKVFFESVPQYHGYIEIRVPGNTGSGILLRRTDLQDILKKFAAVEETR